MPSESEKSRLQQPKTTNSIPKKYSFSVLLLVGFCGFFQLLSFNTYTVLQPALANSPICLNSTSKLNRSVKDCCSDCLGIGNDNYNIMFSLMWGFSIVSVLVAGWSVDKFGHKMLIVFGCISIVGHSLIATSGIMQSEPAVLTVLFAGSILWGCSLLPIMNARNKIISVWFRDSQLFLAFGIASSIFRSASIPAFLLIELIREKIGLQLTLMLSPMFAILSTVCAVCAVVIDVAGLKKLGLTDQIKKGNSAVKISDILHLSKLFWPLVIGVSLLLTSYYAVIDNSVQMVHQKFGFTKQSAAMISGSIEYVGIASFLIVGYIVDKLGRPIIFLIISSFLIISMSLLLAFTFLHPTVGLLGFGFELTFYSTAGVGSLMLAVPTSCTGIASAIHYSISCLLITASHASTAAILGHHGIPDKEMQVRWMRVMLLVAGLGAAALVLNGAVTFISCAQNNALISSRRHHTQSYEQISDEGDQPAFSDEQEMSMKKE